MTRPFDPFSVDIPEQIATDRLILRAAHPDEAQEMNLVICQSAAALQEWMPWATPVPSVSDTMQYCRRSAARFLLREQLDYRIRLKSNGTFIGSIGLQGIEWKLPRFEIGYWLATSATGNGYMSEAVRALSALAFDKLAAVRVEIKTDDANIKSWSVAERAGFQLEGTLRNDQRRTDGALRHTRIYAVISAKPK